MQEIACILDPSVFLSSIIEINAVMILHKPLILNLRGFQNLLHIRKYT
jgi:hypothetical protein